MGRAQLMESLALFCTDVIAAHEYPGVRMSRKELEDIGEAEEEAREEELFHPHGDVPQLSLPLPPPSLPGGRPPFAMGLGLSLLRSAETKNATVLVDLKKSWALHDFSMYLGQSSIAPRERIRELDRLRFHNLHPEDECVLLRLPSRRIDIQSTKDVIMLCGGLVGVRFESAELRLISSTCADLERTWIQLDRLYKSMPSSVTKIGGTIDDIDMQQVVEDFHKLCDNYVHDLQNIQDIVKVKQATIDRNAELMKMEADPSSNVGAPYPKWLMILKAKYEKVVADERAAAAAGTGESSPKQSSVFPLGKFSVFICLGMQGHFDFNQQEKESITDIFEASRDNEEIFDNMAMIRVFSADMKMKYFARRFFNFLKSLPELKSAIRDEASVDKFVYI